MLKFSPKTIFEIKILCERKWFGNILFLEIQFFSNLINYFILKNSMLKVKYFAIFLKDFFIFFHNFFL
jgi:hypothetical protein